MSMKFFRNPRKAIAVALVGLGLAGVSVASAATLSLNGNDSNLVQAGTVTVDGACQTSEIVVSFTLDGAAPGALDVGGNWGYTDAEDALVLTAIDGDCAGRTIKVALGTAGGVTIGDEYEDTAVAGALTLALTGAGAEFGGLSAAQVSSIAQVSVTIFD